MDGQVIKSTQEQFDVFIDESAVVDQDAFPDSFYEESRKVILKGSCFAFEFFIGKRLHSEAKVFLVVIRQLHNDRNFILSSVALFSIGHGGMETEQLSKFHRFPTILMIKGVLKRTEITSRLRFILKFEPKADDSNDKSNSMDIDKATLASDLRKELESSSSTDVVMVSWIDFHCVHMCELI